MIFSQILIARWPGITLAVFVLTVAGCGDTSDNPSGSSTNSPAGAAQTSAESETSARNGGGGNSNAEALLRFEEQFPAMGVLFSVTGYAKDIETARVAFERAKERVEQIEQAISNYREDSEVQLLVRSAPHEDPVAVGDDLMEMIKLSKRISTQTDRAFDPSSGAIFVLWKKAIREKRIPTEEEIAIAKESSGFEHVSVESGMVQIDCANLVFDFGGIGKGYAADQVVIAMQENGILYCLVDAGGDIRCCEPPPGKESWAIEIQTGSTDETLSIELSNQAIATSGDATQFLEVDGVRYSHIVDPRTGRAVTGQRAATVIAGDGTTADAYASAACVLGADVAVHLANDRPGVDIRVVENPESGLRAARSSGFPESAGQ